MTARTKLLRSVIVAFFWVMITAGVGHAHGGMAGPDEIGPPMGISVTIGLASYWIITLWPARRREDERKPASKSVRRVAK